MAVTVKIRYPEPSDAVTTEALDTLRRFEPALCEHMVAVMCSTSNYRWEHVTNLQSDTYFRLIKRYDDSEVITIGLRELSEITADDLIERIHLTQVFPENRPHVGGKEE